MKKLFPFILATVVITACNDADNKADSYASSTSDQAEKKNATDAAVDQASSDFLMKAATGGMMEVELGQMAQRNATSQQVKDFGNMMVNDHSKANAELKTLAASRNVTLPPMVEGKHRDHLNELGKTSGEQFDKEYIDLMVSDHKEDISLFENAANNSKDADVRAFAAKTLPVLKAHHEAAKKLHDQLKQ